MKSGEGNIDAAAMNWPRRANSTAPPSRTTESQPGRARIIGPFRSIGSGNNAKAPLHRSGGLSRNPGGDLLFPRGDPQVPSALVGLTAVFGMGTGISPPP